MDVALDRSISHHAIPSRFPEGGKMLHLIRSLFEQLNAREIRYCHWKSNMNLDEALAGKTDLDLLVDRRHVSVFQSIVAALRFKLCREATSGGTGSVYHYFGLDEATGILVHLHVYYRIITCGSLLKNHHLPLEEMLLQNVTRAGIVPVPERAAELVLFVLRKTMERQSFLEMLTLFASREAIGKEVAWLRDAGTQARALELVDHWLPTVGGGLFVRCMQSLESNEAPGCRLFTARKLAASLRPYRVCGTWQASLLRSRRLMNRVLRRYLRRKERKILVTGGAVIGIVGPEATGKSTIQREISRWLAGFLRVETLHAGKPPSTWLSVLPNSMIPLVRKLLPSFRSSKIKEGLKKAEVAEGRPRKPGMFIVFALRSILVAYDRRKLLRKAFRVASRGAIVICDRYPSHVLGAMDSPQVREVAAGRKGTFLTRVLPRIEEWFYCRIPAPDIVIRLTVPIETALKRNVLRDKAGGPEDEGYVRHRHEGAANQHYRNGITWDVNTDKPLPETVSEVKKMVWESL